MFSSSKVNCVTKIICRHLKSICKERKFLKEARYIKFTPCVRLSIPITKSQITLHKKIIKDAVFPIYEHKMNHRNYFFKGYFLFIKHLKSLTRTLINNAPFMTNY